MIGNLRGLYGKSKLEPKFLEQFLKDAEGHDVEWVLAYLKTRIRDLEHNPANPTYGFYDAIYKNVDQQFKEGSVAPISDWHNLM